jgi:hypothetical protein
MFSHCIFCRAPLGANQTLEHFPHGRRVAFDAERGRLWAVCTGCGRWNLAPFEERWEALEELERLTVGRARLLSQTDNVALLAVGEMDIVRVGRAPLAEEAWWRYGHELLRRRGLAASLLILDVLLLPVFSPLARYERSAQAAWRGASACARCGRQLTAIRYHRVGSLVLAASPDGELALHLPCKRCRNVGEAAGHWLAGADGRMLLRRALAYGHFSGATQAQVRDAASAIEHAGSATAFARGMASRPARLRDLRRSDSTRSIALEIAVNDETERALLGQEVAELESRWREEENIAAIADRELTFFPAPHPEP